MALFAITIRDRFVYDDLLVWDAVKVLNDLPSEELEYTEIYDPWHGMWFSADEWLNNIMDLDYN